MKIKEIIVVEGKNDTKHLQQLSKYDINSVDTIETNGCFINKYKILEIELALKKRGVIVFTDMDMSGFYIRKIINEIVPNVKNAFLPLNEVKKKKNYEVENAPVDEIMQSLNKVCTFDNVPVYSDISYNFLLDKKLIGPKSSTRRKIILHVLGIKYCNSKKFLKNLIKFNITSKDLMHIINSWGLNE